LTRLSFSTSLQGLHNVFETSKQAAELSLLTYQKEKLLLALFLRFDKCGIEMSLYLHAGKYLYRCLQTLLFHSP